MLRKILPFVFVLAGIAFMLLYFTSLFSVSELVYPERLTSASLIDKEKEKIRAGKDTLFEKDILTNPQQLKLAYSNFNVQVAGNILLKGWYIKQEDAVTAKTILILHDINESKISQLPTADALFQLGFNICMMDLQAHGESGGDKFLINDATSSYLSVVLDSLYCLFETNRVAVLAPGVSALLAVNWMVNDKRADILVLQNPINKFNNLLKQRVKQKWGSFASIVYPLAKMNYKKSAGIQPDSLNLSEWVQHIKKPMMVVITDSATEMEAKDALAVYEKAASPKKKIWTSKSRSFITNDGDIENNLYRAISAFINSNTIDKARKIKSRKRIAEA